MADVFGDDSLFSEFERDRDTQNIFIQYDRDESGQENISRIIFRGAESDSDDSDIDDAMQNGKEMPADSAVLGEEGPQEAQVDGEEATEVKEETEDSEQSNAPYHTTYQENFEKTKLRQFARILDSTRTVSDDQSPGVQIVFQNNRFAKKYRSRIEQFIISLTQHADKKDFTKPATDLSAKGTTVTTCVDINSKLPTEKRNNRMWQAHGIIGCAHFHNGFMVDTQGWPQDEEDQREIGSAEVPKYFQVFEEVFPPDETTEQSLKPPPKAKDACFNCGGDHRLSECVTPKDHNRIRAKRRERQENSAKFNNPGRYHEDPELDPKKAKFVAGTISEGLREALGLKGDQLPSYIYRMRMFGYPPGWLVEANRKSSALAMYDKDGRETNIRGESLEDGEYSEQSSATEFDVSKIIEYPGFTVPVPAGFMDESASKGMPPIQHHQLKTTLMEDLASKEASRKRQLEEEEAKSNKKMKTSDMDLVNEDQDSPVPQKTSTPAEGEKTGVEKEGEGGSPSMDSLQRQYSDIMHQLDAEGDCLMANGDLPPTVPPVETTTTSPDTSRSSPSQSELLREKNFSFSSCASVSRDFGTPILVREKSFKALPDADKFSQGVEEHIPFENLPDSVGTFEKMRNLFSLIRNKMKKPKK